MRNYNMDFIRGIALLGLVYMNAYGFGISNMKYTPLSSPPISDAIIHAFNCVFVDGRFRTLFSVLFGAGLYIQWQQCKSTVLIKKRLYWLMLFGLAHGFLLWAGDILFLYSVSGWFILKYLDSDNERLLKHSVGFISLSLLMVMLVGYSSIEEPIYRDSKDFISLYSPAYLDYFITNFLFNVIMMIAAPILTMWMCVGLMLMGIYFYKLEVFTRGLNTQQLLFAITGAIMFSAFRLYTNSFNNGLLFAMQEPINILAALFTAALYIHLAVMFCNNTAKVGRLIQCVGRISLTLYIVQTVMQLLVYKVVFTHWVLSFNRIDYWLVATVLIVLQLGFTAIYSRYFKQGPLEVLLRNVSRAKINA